MGWNDFWDRVEDNFTRVFDQVQAQQDRIMDQANMDSVFGSDAIAWLRQNGPLTAMFFDHMGLGLGVGHLIWDELEPPENLITWNGERYQQYRDGFVIEFGFDAKVTDIIIDPAEEVGTLGPHTYFVGHLPDCEFDELTMTMTGGEYLDEETPAFIGANVYQVKEPEDEEQSGIVTVSGYEEAFREDEPSRIYRSSLRLPWRSSLRVSETYGGPTLSRQPTFIQVYAYGVDLSTPTVNDWEVQTTVRFIANTLR